MTSPLDIRAFDFETDQFRAGLRAPLWVCASTADTGSNGELLIDNALGVFRDLLERHRTAFANAPYDLAVAAAADSSLLSIIFKALREGRVHDVITAEALHAIYQGHLGEMPNGQPLYNPATGKQTKRYSLPLSVFLTLGRADAKENDAFRKSYAIFRGVSPDRWPEQARVYPVDDSRNTRDVALAQINGRPGEHRWRTLPRIPGDNSFLDVEVCECCGVIYDASFKVSSPCPKAPRTEPHKNLGNLPAQIEADFALHLGACWSLRTDSERVEKLAAEVEEKHRKAVARFQKFGWIRQNETEDQAAVKRAIAVAYGATGKCKRCGGDRVCHKCRGSGKDRYVQTCSECNGAGRLIGVIQNVDVVECRGDKVRGRYKGCLGASCPMCRGGGGVQKPGSVVTCKVEFHTVNGVTEQLWGCDGTGLDLSTAMPQLPRTDKDGVKTDRDTTMESGNDDLSDYGENEFEKSRTTYVPYLRTGVTVPLYYSPNVIVATGRCSIENSPLHQMPRFGGERECIRARGAWCGYPIEMVLGSTDYEAGELDTLFQLCYWLFGYSQGRDAINASGKPGILHSDLAAQVLGLSLEEFLARLKAKDKQAIDFRQASKPINFGTPGGMGTPKFVLTQRKKNSGFTTCERGPATNAKGEPGYWGIRFCVLTGGAKECGVRKIMEWGKKKYPCAPVCAACADVVENILRPAYFRRYPEVRDYFRWVQKRIDRNEPAPTAVWDAEAGQPRIIRERGGCDFPAYCNNGFQSLLSDIGKHAFVTATRECYLGVKDDGSPSPLAGCRLPLYLHDEPLSELIAETAHLSGPRIAEIMMESGRLMAPDVVWKAETALARWWSKSMEPRYSDGKLILWEPEKKS